METKFIFFGTDEFSTVVLDELQKEALVPSLIITAPDRKVGRGLTLTSPLVKTWALKNKVEVLQPEKLDAEFAKKIAEVNSQFFIVASYGKIIPKFILDIPPKGTLNVHPSLLPKYRGASPIESQILNDEKEVGVSIMLLDAEMDHGPLLGKEKLIASAMPMPANILHHLLASVGGRLLCGIIPKWLSGEIEGEEQNHKEATFTKKISREDGLLDLEKNHRENYLKFLAFDPWPGVYFFTEKNGEKKRIKITNAEFVDDKFRVTKVVPEGGKEMSYEDFLRGLL